MPRPLIGLTMDVGAKPENYSLHSGYTTSVEKAGGIPLGIPYRSDISLIPEFLDRLDGILFTGGDDLDPGLYGQEWHPKAIKLDPARQSFELALIAEVERRRLPSLGICLGSQLLNVHRGGSMHQFLPDVPRPNAIEHRKLERDLPRHPLHIEPQSSLAQIIRRTEINGNTYHKQAADRLGRGLRVIATAPDGIIEGFEDPSFPLLVGVQWHPERLHNEPEHLAIFKLLVEKAADAHRGGSM